MSITVVTTISNTSRVSVWTQPVHEILPLYMNDALTSPSAVLDIFERRVACLIVVGRPSRLSGMGFGACRAALNPKP